MSIEITTAMVNGYRANVDFLLQQRGSLLRPFVRNEMQASESEFYDRIGATAVNERFTRHADTQHVDTPHDRRMITLRTFDWSDLIDKPDKVKLLMDPASSYAQNMAWAFGRNLDDLIIAAAFGNAQSGKTGTVSVPHDVANQRIAVDYHDAGGSGNTNLSIDKLRRASTILKAAQNDPMEPRYIVLSANNLQAMLRATETISADFNTIKALVQGEINQFMGFTWITHENLLTDGSSFRRILCFQASGLLVATGLELDARITEESTKNFSVQVWGSHTANATRMEEKKVVEILADETV